MKMKRWLSILLCTLLCIGLLPVTTLAAAETPTRTTTLNLNDYPETTDMLESEGWKWVPTENGGTLTLHNCYIQTDNSNVLVFPTASDVSNYQITIQLEGTNILESNIFGSSALITNHPSPTSNMDLTITGSENAELQLLTTWPQSFDSAPSVYPYGLAANNITLESGNIYSNVGFCISDKNININGGSLTVDANNIMMNSTYYDCVDGLYSRAGNVNISGGTVSLNVGRNGIFIPGTNAAAAEQAVYITGGNVTIQAGHNNNSENCIGIAAKNIYIDTENSLDIYGRDTALAIWLEGGEAEINGIGTEFSLSKSESSSFNLIYQRNPETNPITICNANYSEVNAAIAHANSLTPELYQNYDSVTAALEKVDTTKTALEQAEVNAMAQAIETAIAALEYKPADYTAVNEAIARAEALNPDNYIDFSAVNAARSAVVEGKNITEQDAVNAMAQAIEDAIAALEFKAADYTKVDEAIAKAEALNPDDYKNFSAVESAVNAVVRGKNITEQDAVDAMVQAIEEAISGLEKKQSITADPVTPSGGNKNSSATPSGSGQSTTTAPGTGDNSQTILWVILLLAAGAALTGTVIYSRKRTGSRQERDIF